MHRNHLRFAAALAVVLLVPATGRAQEPAPATPDTAAVAAARLPALTPLFDPASSHGSPVAPTLAAVRRQLSQGQTLMIIGGSAVLAGILVGDDAGTILILGGVAIGGYGLYLHLNSTSGR